MGDRVEHRVLPWLRAGFLVAVVVCAWLGLRGRTGEIGAVSPVGVVGALLLVLVGLAATGVLWLRLMAALGARLPIREGFAVFFVGQLGKYVPGSVWSLGAQADLARRASVPPRLTVAAGLVFLGYHLATGVVLGCSVLLLGPLDAPWPGWVSGAALAVALVGLLPVVVRPVTRRVAGRSLDLGVSSGLVCVALMALAWTAYAGALVLLAPGTPWWHLLALGGAFALSYAVGVVVVLAPAGLGAREGVFVVLLTPLLGVTGATALALLARVVHTAADALMAAGWWWAGRRAGASAGQPVAPREHAELGDTTPAGPEPVNRHR